MNSKLFGLVRRLGCAALLLAPAAGFAAVVAPDAHLPEPATMALLGFGAAGAFMAKRRKKK